MVSANHLLSLINDVLQMSKLEDGSIELSHEPIDLVELTRDIVTIVVDRAVEAGIHWDYEKGKSVIPYRYIYGSPLHIRQIFLNIYGNCIKYNHPGTFDAILMDVMMPVMNGLTAARTIRALDHPDAQTIPIIAMTANAFQGDAQECLDAGMNAHLAKPLQITNVMSTIAQYCKK